MYEYLQFSTKSIAKAILSSSLECKNASHMQYLDKAETNSRLNQKV